MLNRGCNGSLWCTTCMQNVLQAGLACAWVVHVAQRVQGHMGNEQQARTHALQPSTTTHGHARTCASLRRMACSAMTCWLTPARIACSSATCARMPPMACASLLACGAWVAWGEAVGQSKKPLVSKAAHGPRHAACVRLVAGLAACAHLREEPTPASAPTRSHPVPSSASM